MDLIKKIFYDKNLSIDTRKEILEKGMEFISWLYNKAKNNN